MGMFLSRLLRISVNCPGSCFMYFMFPGSRIHRMNLAIKDSKREGGKCCDFQSGSRGFGSEP